MHWNNGCRITTGKVSCINNLDQLTDADALHEEIEVKYFYEGSATLLVESKTISVKAGDIVVINPFAFHATINTGKTKGKYHLFMIPLDYFSGIPELDLHKQFFLEEKGFHTHFSDAPELCSFLQKAVEEVEQQQLGFPLMVKSQLLGFFTLLQRYGTDHTEKALADQKKLRLYSIIKPAMHRMKNEYHRNLTIDEMAELCNVSKHYFCRVFKSVTGKGPMEYLRDFRLHVANALLTDTGKSIAEISEHCGFENPNYFSRCYKKHYGVSPSSNRAAKRQW